MGGSRVFVYWNLHRDLYSVRNTKTKRVEQHVEEIVLHDAEFVVSQAGRLRVLRERQKNVHAGVRGGEGSALRLGHWVPVGYNPYKFDSFVRLSDRCPVVGADEVWMWVQEGVARVYARGLRFKVEELE